MADSKLTALTEISVPALEDITLLSDDPSGTPVSVKVTLKRLLALMNHTCQGRLTLTSGTPVTTADVTGATNVYFTPLDGDKVALYDGTRWQMYSFTERTLALGTLVNAQGYDVFLYDNSGTLTLESLEWANATVTMTIATPCVVTWTSHGMSTGDSITFTTSGALPTGLSANTQYFITSTGANTFNLSTSLTNVAAGTLIATSGSQSGTHTGHQPQARATALTTQDGVLVKTGATTRRYLGSFMTTSTTTTEDSYGGASQAGGHRFLFNYYNQQPRDMGVIDTTNSWTYTTAAFRAADGADANKVEFFCGYETTPITASVIGRHANASAVNTASGIGIDAVTTNSAKVYHSSTGPSATSSNQPSFAEYTGFPGIGYHSLTWLEYSAATGSTTWYGDAGLAFWQTGLIARVYA